MSKQPDKQELAQWLNQDSQCIVADLETLPDWKHMLASYPVFLLQKEIDEMSALVTAIGELVARTEYSALVREAFPELDIEADQTQGVLYGYDFHMGDDGPQLIEVNTNAGGILLNNSLSGVQKACCDQAKKLMREPVIRRSDLPNRLVEMFRKEFVLARPGQTLKRVAIMDDKPEQQFLYSEFKSFEKLLSDHGIDVVIAAPESLHYDGHAVFAGEQEIDLIYNRHTDFYLRGDSLHSLADAYQRGGVVLTPNPSHYARYADKRLLTLWSSEQFLKSVGIGQQSRQRLLASIPQTRLLTPMLADTLWSERKHLFFKPATGFGSRASYAGNKLTRKTWQMMVENGNYIAQSYVAPSWRQFELNGEKQSYKVDVRNYVYGGEVLQVAARLYRGQTTNMRTTGGGFASVYVV